MGIEEVERDTPHLHLPDRNVDGRVEQRDLDHELAAVIVENPEDRGGIAIQDLGDVLLPPVRLDMLVKITLGIHEPDSDRRHAEIARCFDVIPGEDAKPPRVERK